MHAVTAPSESQLLALTNQVYDAAAGVGWSPVGAALLDAFDAVTGTIMLGTPSGGIRDILFRGDLPQEAVVAYSSHYRSVDLWTARAAASVLRGGARDPGVWASGTLVPDREFLRSEFYCDFGRQLGLRYVVGTVIPLGTELMPIGLHRPEGARPFEPDHLRLFAHLVPHLRRAMQVAGLIRPTEIALSGLAALDALACGVLVVDGDLRVRLANRAAEALAGPNRPLRLRRTRSAEAQATLLGAADRADEAALTALVRATALAGAAGGAVALHDPTGAASVAALVAPLPGRLIEDETAGRIPGRAVVLLRRLRGASDQIPAELLGDLFGLTRAEAEVARDLMGGATKATVARRRNTQASTVHTLVRAILAKTGAANLRDLERLIARLQ